MELKGELHRASLKGSYSWLPIYRFVFYLFHPSAFSFSFAAPPFNHRLPKQNCHQAQTQILHSPGLSVTALLYFLLCPREYVIHLPLKRPNLKYAPDFMMANHLF